MLRPIRGIAVSICLGSLCWTSNAPAQWGDVTGRIVFEGELPKLEPKVKQGAAAGNDAQFCGAHEIRDYTLTINPDDKGVADVFVYIRQPSKVNPDLAAVPTEPVILDQKDCQFIPHAMVVRCKQQIIVKSDDPIPHNTNFVSTMNSGYNSIVTPNDREGQKVDIAKANANPEIVPCRIKCDIHPHMEAYAAILNHPYMTVSDASGNFTIKGLPAGKNSLTIWHSKSGYLIKLLDVEVPTGGSKTLDPIKVQGITDQGVYKLKVIP